MIDELKEKLEEWICELIEWKREYSKNNVKLILSFLINKYHKAWFDLNNLLLKLELNFTPDNSLFVLTSLYIDNIIIWD